MFYQHYYGAQPGRGIGVVSTAPYIEKKNLTERLRTLACLRAADEKDADNCGIMYFLQIQNHYVLGLSYVEAPASSGYDRHAPCGLQYVFADDELANVAANLSQIAAFLPFTKHTSQSVRNLPLRASGIRYQFDPAMCTALVEAALQVATEKKDHLLCIVPPKGIGSHYNTARLVLAQLFEYLPSEICLHLTFITSVPGTYDGTISADANGIPSQYPDILSPEHVKVVVCSQKQAAWLASHKKCMIVDMNQPADKTGIKPGEYARFMVEHNQYNFLHETFERYIDDHQSMRALNESVARQKKDFSDRQQMKRNLDSLNEYRDKMEVYVGRLKSDEKRKNEHIAQLEHQIQVLQQPPAEQQTDGNPKTAPQTAPAKAKDKSTRPHDDAKEKRLPTQMWVGIALVCTAALALGLLLGWLIFSPGKPAALPDAPAITAAATLEDAQTPEVTEDPTPGEEAAAQEPALEESPAE